MKTNKVIPICNGTSKELLLGDNLGKLANIPDSRYAPYRLPSLVTGKRVVPTNLYK